MIGIYKITNIVNNKSYIGMSINIEQRWEQHKTSYKKGCSNTKFYNAMKKYGIDNFLFEVLEECSVDQLQSKEKMWIDKMGTYVSGYNSTVGGDVGGFDRVGDKHPKSVVTESEVIEIRNRYAKLERKKDVYEDYKHKISKSGFHKIWNGSTWTHISMNVYSESNKKYHKYNTANAGSLNGRAKISEEQVLDIRTRRSNGEPMGVVYEGYSNIFSKGYFKNIWYGDTWKK